MELTKTEFAHIKEVVESAADEQLVTLSELQLVLVGGGSGDISTH